jgi:hypothetical protein
MRKFGILLCIILIVTWLVLLFHPHVGRVEYYAGRIDADILSTEQRILDGKWTGRVLGSSSGTIRNDLIKIGIRFKIHDHIYLHDVILRHSELAHFTENGKNILPLYLHIHAPKSWWFYDYSQLELRSHSRKLLDIYVSRALTDDLLEMASK